MKGVLTIFKQNLLVSGMMLLMLAAVVLIIYVLSPPKVGTAKLPICLTLHPSSGGGAGETYLIEIDSKGAIYAYRGSRTGIAESDDESIEIKQYLESVEASSNAWLSEQDQQTLDKALAKLPATPKEREDVTVYDAWSKTLFLNGKAYKLLGDETSGDVYDAVKLIMSLSPLPIVIQGYA